MKKAFSYFFFGLVILAGLYVSSLYNYLLFHNLAEIEGEGNQSMAS